MQTMFKLKMGRKRRCRSVRVKKHMRERENNVEDDKISELPDHVLVFILSLMTMKQAARTSVLSRRWRKVWTFIPSLNFGTPHKLDFRILPFHWSVPLVFKHQNLRFIHAERRQQRHVNWINRVLESHQGSAIDEFRVRFALNETHACDIDRWVNFASEKKVREFVLDFRKFGDWPQGQRNYTFPLLCNTARRLPSRLLGFPDFSSLRTLKLKQVNVSGDGIEYLLSSCRYLGKLCVIGSDSLVDLKVDGQSLCLKHLKIKRCVHLESIHISSTKLLSFKYSGQRTSISFGNVPNLVELYFGGNYGEHITPNFSELRNFAFRLEKLTLHALHIEESTFLSFPELTHLKNLKLLIKADMEGRLLALVPLIEASPSLQRFVLELQSYEFDPRVMRIKAAGESAVQLESKIPFGCKLVLRNF